MIVNRFDIRHFPKGEPGLRMNTTTHGHRNQTYDQNPVTPLCHHPKNLILRQCGHLLLGCRTGPSYPSSRSPSPGDRPTKRRVRAGGVRPDPSAQASTFADKSALRRSIARTTTHPANTPPARTRQALTIIAAQNSSAESAGPSGTVGTLEAAPKRPRGMASAVRATKTSVGDRTRIWEGVRDAGPERLMGHPCHTSHRQALRFRVCSGSHFWRRLLSQYSL